MLAKRMSTLLTWTAAGPGGHTLQQAVCRPSDPEGIVDALRELAHLLIGTDAVLVGNRPGAAPHASTGVDALKLSAPAVGAANKSAAMTSGCCATRGATSSAFSHRSSASR